MKPTLFLAGSLLAFSAHAGPVAYFPNDVGGATVLYDETSQCGQGYKKVVSYDKEKKPVVEGCWFTHGYSVGILWVRGREGQISVAPVAGVEWLDGKQPPTEVTKRSDI